MVVLEPVLDGERFLVCECGQAGLVSPVQERSNFYARSRKCKDCRKRMARDPGRRERSKVQRRARIEELRKDPEAWEEYQERVARPARRRYRERRSDRKKATDRRYAATHRPVYRAASRRYRRRNRQALVEAERMRRREAAEARGRPLPTLDRVARSQNRTGQKLPIEPFRRWVEEVLAQETRKASFRGESDPEGAAKQHVAGLLGVSIRTVRRYRFEMTEVYEGIVDHAVSRHGKYHILDLYPDLYADLEEAA